jgi:AcrR family transcriptional regulator
MAARMTRQESTAATRADLLDAARRVLVERGYHGASLDLVAREAGFTKGAVYSAFGSKGGMFLAVLERETDERWTRIEREIEADLAAGLEVDLTAEGSHDWFERFRTHREWTLALLEFRLHAARDVELNAAYAEVHRRTIARLAGVVARVTGAGEREASELALAIVALGNGFVLEHLALPGEATEARYAEASAALAQHLLGHDGR